jgi:hypothetical protein
MRFEGTLVTLITQIGLHCRGTRAVRILVVRSRRPRRWAGVAIFAGVIAGVLYAEHREIHAPMHLPPLDLVGVLGVHESVEGEIARSWSGATNDHKAQDTGFASSKSVSTDGEMPTR